LRPNTPTPTTATGIELGDDRRNPQRPVAGKDCKRKAGKEHLDYEPVRLQKADAAEHGCGNLREKGFRRPMRTIALLTISNIFMTFAWYGHLKYRNVPLYKVILISWLIAFFEYCFQVPANRIGSYEFSAVQLKTIQEVITLVVFSVFSVLYLGQSIRWNHVAGFAMIVGAVGLIFKQW
jgi:uncharacterized protein